MIVGAVLLSRHCRVYIFDIYVYNVFELCSAARPACCGVIFDGIAEGCVGVVIERGGEYSCKVHGDRLLYKVVHCAVVGAFGITDLHGLLKERGSYAAIALGAEAFKHCGGGIGILCLDGNRVEREGECHAGAVFGLFLIILRNRENAVLEVNILERTGGYINSVNGVKHTRGLEGLG